MKFGLERWDYFYLISSRCSSIAGTIASWSHSSMMKDKIKCTGMDRCSIMKKYGRILKSGFTRKLPCNY